MVNFFLGICVASLLWATVIVLTYRKADRDYERIRRVRFDERIGKSVR